MVTSWPISSFAALGGLLFSYDWVVIGGAKPFFQSYFQLTSASQIVWANGHDISSVLSNIAWTGSINFLFMLVTMGTVDRVGRCPLMLVPVTWVVLSEFFPNRIRGAAMSMAAAALCIAYFILTHTFPILNTQLCAAGTFCLCTAIWVAGFFFTPAKLPETKDKTFDEIEKQLVD